MFDFATSVKTNQNICVLLVYQYFHVPSNSNPVRSVPLAKVSHIEQNGLVQDYRTCAIKGCTLFENYVLDPQIIT